MTNTFIDVPVKLTSFEFYNNLLPKSQNVEINNSQSIIIDFSQTDNVSPLVIPNLLCLGRILYSKHQNSAKIYIPETMQAGIVKNYFNEIGFTNYADRFGAYEFINPPLNGLDGAKINPLCNTLYFAADYTRDEISRIIDNYVAPFSEAYLSDFSEYLTFNNGMCDQINLIRFFLNEMIINCNEHASSISFMTMHARYSDKVVYVSVSDIGPGFINTIGKETGCKDELEAILKGVYKRQHVRDYGLFNVILLIIQNGGKVRIHSNTTQVIFTKRLLQKYKENRLLYSQDFNRFNVKKTSYFRGVHLEIEIPLKED